MEVNLRDYEMALNVVRIWLQSGDFALCYTKQLIGTYELDKSFFSALVGLGAIEAHYSQSEVYKAGLALPNISTQSVINEIFKDSKPDLSMEEILKQLLTEIIRPIVMEAVRDALKGEKREVKHTKDLPVKVQIDKPQPESLTEAKYLNKMQAAAYLGIGEITMNNYICTGRISGEKIGPVTFFLKADLDAYKNSLQRKRGNGLPN